MNIKTILFDLDGTLLPVDIEVFLRYYLRALGERCAHLIEPARLAEIILDSTKAMVKNLEPAKTNQQVFYEHFLSQVDVPRNIWEPLFSRFYAEDFPKLQRYCPGREPVARSLMEELEGRGIDVIIATNPIFPREAILERMRWAGVADFNFKLITSYEGMHFCKPNIEYYEEIIELTGIDPESSLMVGNDMEEDMIASAVGMKTFLVEGWVIDRGTLRYTPDFRGPLASLLALIRDEGPIKLEGKKGYPNLRQGAGQG